MYISGVVSIYTKVLYKCQQVISLFWTSYGVPSHNRIVADINAFDSLRSVSGTPSTPFNIAFDIEKHIVDHYSIT